MKSLQYNYRLLLVILPMLVLSSSCVENDWDDVKQPALPTPDLSVNSLMMDFNSVSMVEGQYLTMPEGWLNVGANGTHRAFQTSVMAAVYNDLNSKKVQCAQATAYLSLGDVDAWLITPPIKVAEAANDIFRYSLFSAYTGTSSFQVLCYSTKSTGGSAPSLDSLEIADEWQLMGEYDPDITAEFEVEQKSLAPYLLPNDDVVYVAFRYSKKNDGSSSNTWYVDNISYNVTLPVEGEVVLLKENFGSKGTTAAPHVNVADYEGYAKRGMGAANVVYEASGGVVSVRNNSSSSGYTGASGNSNAMMAAGGASLIVKNIASFGARNITLSFGSNETSGILSLAFSADNGGTWESVSYSKAASGWGLVSVDITLPAGIDEFALRFTAASTQYGTRVDDITVIASDE